MTAVLLRKCSFHLEFEMIVYYNVAWQVKGF